MVFLAAMLVKIIVRMNAKEIGAMIYKPVGHFIFKMGMAALLLQGAALPNPARAADQPAPAQAPEKLDPNHFYLFHGDVTNPDTVKADVFYCMALARDIRGYAPTPSVGGGLFGAAIAAGIQAKQQSTDRKRKGRLAMRICMAQFGYTRYSAAALHWEKLPDWGDLVKDENIKADEAPLKQILDFATGPKPEKGELDK